MEQVRCRFGLQDRADREIRGLTQQSSQANGDQIQFLNDSERRPKAPSLRCSMSSSTSCSATKRQPVLVGPVGGLRLTDPIDFRGGEEEE